MKVYLVTEVLAREVLGNLLLASLLAERGHTAIILNQEDAFVLSSGSVSGTTVFHAKSIHYSQSRILQHQKLRQEGFRLTVQDQESALIVPDSNLDVESRFCGENLELFDRVYSWSSREAEAIKTLFPEFASKVITTGSPRVDTWKRRFKNMAGLRSSRRPLILLTPSVHMNHYMRHWEWMGLTKSVTQWSPTLDRGFEYGVEELCDQMRSQLFFVRCALILADAFPDCDVLVQPKKNEILESWSQWLNAVDEHDGTRPNLIIGSPNLLEESIHQASVVINSTSTAGVIALIAEVPLISFGPTASLASSVGVAIRSVESVVALVGEALSDSERFMAAYSEADLKGLDNRLEISPSGLSAQRIVDDLESLDTDVGPSSLTFRDVILRWRPGTVRRFFSRLKSMFLLSRPAWANEEMLGEIQQERVEHLLSVMRAELGLSPNVRASVLGGRNIVVRRDPSILVP